MISKFIWSVLAPKKGFPRFPSQAKKIYFVLLDAKQQHDPF